MRKTKKQIVAALCLAAFGSGSFAPLQVSAKTTAAPKKVSVAGAPRNIIGALNFDPKTDGYKFENYGNENRSYKKDLTVDDMIRLFGAETVCKTGAAAGNCVMKAAARQWMDKQLEGMDGGHCEGMAVTALRLKTGKPFKSRAGNPAAFQSGATRTADLSLNEILGNYIAYYFITQTFDEVTAPTEAASKGGPVAIAQKLAEAMNSGGESYTLGFYKYNRASGEKSDGHAITPIAVEDAGNSYRIHVYDNNYPGEIRYINVQKSGKQTWKYVTSTNPREPAAEYEGDLETQTLEITPTSAREKTCYSAPFAEAGDEKKCVAAVREEAKTNPQTPPPAVAATKIGNPQTPLPAAAKVGSPNTAAAPAVAEPERVEFAINNDGNMLVVAPGGKRIGYDPATDKFYNEIATATANLTVGGRGRDLPLYRLPFVENGSPYEVVFSGKDLDAESDFDFSYSAPGFTVGFDSVLIDPNETLKTTISPDGETITFTSSADGETPDIFFAFDPEDDSGDSYLVEIDGAEIEAGKTLTVHLDFENDKLEIRDNDGNSDEYEIEILRIKPDGTEQQLKKGFKETGSEIETDLDDWIN